MLILNDLGGNRNGPDSRIIGSIENLGDYTSGTSNSLGLFHTTWTCFVDPAIECCKLEPCIYVVNQVNKPMMRTWNHWQLSCQKDSWALSRSPAGGSCRSNLVPKLHCWAAAALALCWASGSESSDCKFVDRLVTEIVVTLNFATSPLTFKTRRSESARRPRSKLQNVDLQLRLQVAQVILGNIETNIPQYAIEYGNGYYSILHEYYM